MSHFILGRWAFFLSSFLSKVGWATLLQGDEPSILLSFLFLSFLLSFFFKLDEPFCYKETSLIIFGEPFCYGETSLPIFYEKTFWGMCTELWTRSQERIWGKWRACWGKVNFSGIGIWTVKLICNEISSRFFHNRWDAVSLMYILVFRGILKLHGGFSSTGFKSCKGL